jgi:single-strand DNA-binding protein
MDLNKVMLIGRLTRDPELRSTPSGKSVASFSIATSRQWTDAQGQKQKQSEFHNCVVWGKLAEVAQQYLRKGSQLYLEGRLQTRDWTGQDGVKRYRTEVVADNFIMLGSKPAGAGSFGGGSSAAMNSEPSYQDAGPQEVVEEQIKVEDIPF